jgi:hypothetical protein
VGGRINVRYLCLRILRPLALAMKLRGWDR